jgi:hypothetical protein
MMRVMLPMSGLAVLLALGGCMETMPGPDRPRPERPRPPRPEAGMCTKEYAPVCAIRGGQRKTFGNACEARAQRYRVISQQPCGG